ncbi:hypothetical protein LMG31841_03924 [Paraburkholderia saeva]|uniref:Uncharacterized protein n=1 Tax=Paraburkholderia saeva TaxID=2777537 RepID=A0A9N8X4B4_9BURK|nr:hypothetical protein LMG31841_03924 [Paraburkholderia saeva]
MKCRPHTSDRIGPRAIPARAHSAPVTKPSSTRLRAARVADRHDPAGSSHSPTTHRLCTRTRRCDRNDPRPSTCRAERPHRDARSAEWGWISPVSRAMLCGDQIVRGPIWLHARGRHLTGCHSPEMTHLEKVSSRSAFLLLTFLWKTPRRKSPWGTKKSKCRPAQGATPIDRHENKERPKQRPSFGTKKKKPRQRGKKNKPKYSLQAPLQQPEFSPAEQHP